MYRIHYSAGYLPQDGDPIANYALVETDEGVTLEFDNIVYPRQNPFKLIEFKVEVKSNDEFTEHRILKSLRDKAAEFHENDLAISYIVPIKHFSEKNEAIDYAEEQNAENEKK